MKRIQKNMPVNRAKIKRSPVRPSPEPHWPKFTVWFSLSDSLEDIRLGLSAYSCFRLNERLLLKSPSALQLGMKPLELISISRFRKFVATLSEIDSYDFYIEEFEGFAELVSDGQSVYALTGKFW